MDRRRFLKTAAGLFVPVAPALILPERVRAQGGMGPGPGTVHSTGGGGLGLQTNLSAFFELDNSLADSTGNVTNLTNNNGVTFTTDTPGATGQKSATFVSASNTSLSHANNVHLTVGTTDFSASMWIKQPITFAGSCMGQSSTAFPQQGWYIDKGFSAFNFYEGNIINNGGFSSSAGGSVAMDHNWALVVIIYDATTGIASCSVNNNAFDVAGTAATPLTSETGTFYIAADGNGASGIDGLICRAGIWKGRKLTIGDVSLLWNSGSGLTYAAMA